MKSITLARSEPGEWFLSDVDRIVKIFADRGLRCSRNQAHWMWESYSDTYCASWLIFPDLDSEIFEALDGYYTIDCED